MSSPLLQRETVPFPLAAENKPAAVWQHLLETPSLSGVTPASRLEVRPAPDMASTGIAQIDALTGGLPRGCLTEICGPESSGRTSLMLSALAAATGREEICALIDASDALDPDSVVAAGVNLGRLLWVRCGAHAASSYFSRKRRQAFSHEERERRRMEDPVEQAMRAADLLLQSSGFGLVVIDLAGIPVKMARRIPLTTWFRFRRAIENTPAILLVIGTQPCAESCTSLALQCGKQFSVLGSQFSVFDTEYSVPGTQYSVFREEYSIRRSEGCSVNENATKLSHAELLLGLKIRTEVLRSRGERKPMQSIGTFATKTAWTA